MTPSPGKPAHQCLEIVQVVQEFSRAGGVETVAFELQREWERTGVSSTVLAATARPLSSGATTRIRFALPQAVLRSVPTRGTGRYLGRALIVPGFTLSASALLRWGRRRGGWAENAVILSHGDSLVADVIVLHSINAESLAQKRDSGEWHWKLNPMHLWVSGRDRLMFNGQRARRYVAVSNRVAAEIVRHHGVSPDRVVIIPNGTDLSRFCPDGPKADLRVQFGIPEGAPILLFVAHEFERKGLPLLIGALAHAPLGPAHVVAVGAGDAVSAARVASGLGVGSRVHFTGVRSDLPELYRAADAFVLPSAYETFSLVCLDAMACGVPVFATRVGGIEDYLSDGCNGFSIERSSESIARVVGAALGDAAMMTRLSAGGREVSLRFGWDEIARKYHDLLREVWHSKQAR